MNINLFKMKDRFDHIIINYLETKEEEKYEKIFSTTEIRFDDILNIYSNENWMSSIKRSEFFQRVKSNNASKIQWASDLNRILRNSDLEIATLSEIKENKISMTPFGIFLFEMENGVVYAISYGYSSILLSNYCDREFGMDFAERVLTKQTVDVESLRYINVNRKKSLTVFSKDSVSGTMYGSSDEYLKGRLMKDNFSDSFDKEMMIKLLLYINKSLEFGTSIKMTDVKVKRESQIDTIEKLGAVIIIIDSFLNKNKSEYFLESSIKLAIPRLNFIPAKSPLIVDLDKLLTKLILKEDATVNIDFYSIIGADVVINDGTEVFLKYPGISRMKVVDLLISDIREFLSQVDIGAQNEVLNGMKIEFENDSNRELKKCLNAEVIFKDVTYVLVDGKWATYNKTFINYIDQEIEKIINDNIIEILGKPYCTSYEELAEYYKKNPSKFEKKYREFIYNTWISEKEGMKLLDTMNHLIESYPNVEVTDLLNNNELIHVKIGDVGTFIENIEQSMISAQIMSESKSKDDLVNKGIMAERLKNSFEVSQLLVLKDTNVEEFNLTAIKSIKFKASLIEWYQLIISLNLKPKIYIASISSGGNKFESYLVP